MGTLTLVGTPIGNLSDISPRGLAALSECDFIAAEDTRVTLKLLNHFNIKKPLISYFEHNKRERGLQICSRIEAGENAVLVTDAGMPAISDPGEELVALCHDRGIPVLAVPGPSAAVTALALSGLPSGRFTFEGFLSVSKRNRKRHLLSLAGECRTIIFYEAPHKLISTLTDMLEAWGDRRLVLCRELTKLHEETIKTTLSGALELYASRSPRGEYVLVIEGACSPGGEEAGSPMSEEAAAASLAAAAELARGLMAEGLSASEAARRSASELDVKKSDVYRLVTRF